MYHLSASAASFFFLSLSTYISYNKGALTLNFLLFTITLVSTQQLCYRASVSRKHIIYVTFQCAQFKMCARSGAASEMKKVNHSRLTKPVVVSRYQRPLTYNHTMAMLPKVESIQHTTGQ